MDSRGLARSLKDLLQAGGRDDRTGDAVWAIESDEALNRDEFRGFVLEWFAGCLAARRELDSTVDRAERRWKRGLKAIRDAVHARQQKSSAVEGTEVLEAFRRERERQEMYEALQAFDGHRTPREFNERQIAQQCYARTFQARAIEFHRAHTSGTVQPDYILAVSTLMLVEEVRQISGRPGWSVVAALVSLLTGQHYTPENLQQRVAFFETAHAAQIARNFLKPREVFLPPDPPVRRMRTGNSLREIVKDADEIQLPLPRRSMTQRRPRA